MLDEGVDQGSDTTHGRTTDGHTNDLAQMATRILGVPPLAASGSIYTMTGHPIGTTGEELSSDRAPRKSGVSD